MTRFKNALLLATVASGAIFSTAVQAQTTASNDSERQLHGTGATSIQTVLVQELNCNGGVGGASGAQSLGLIGTSTVAGTFSTIAEPTDLPTPSGTFNCLTTQLNPGFLAHYVGSGSGVGRTAWRSVGTANTAAFPGVSNPFAAWTKVQYAFADSSVTDSDLTGYTGGTGLTGASYVAGGAPIMIPKFVLPVAVAYASSYGTKSSTVYRFNINASAGNSAPTTILGNSVGGLRLSKTTLCGIFNGTIKNYNNASFTTDNGSTSLKDASDAAARWNADGVPVRLVGRVDKSGTTDIFTRALAAQCGGSYVQNAETLPYTATSTDPDFRSVRPDTAIFPLSTAVEAGNHTAQRIGNTFYNRSTNAYVIVDGSGVSTSNPAAGTVNGTGLFLLADGSGGVAAAINKAADFASASDATVSLNGKIGYIGADYLAGVGSNTLFAAALQNANLASTAPWVLPSAADATVAFGGVRPPQTNAAGSAYDVTDNSAGRIIAIPTYLGGGTGLPTRNNPWAWYNVLYPSSGATLANPASGYPVSGTTQALLYTCYTKDAGGDNAAAIRTFLGWNYDFSATDASGATRTGIFTGVGATGGTSGLLARANIGSLSANWKNAINETFLNQSDPKSLNLYIRNNQTTATCNTRTGV